MDQPFTINKANQTITFGALADKTVGDPPFAVSASGGASGNQLTFSSTTPGTCSVADNAVTILHAMNVRVLGPADVRRKLALRARA